MAAEVEQAFPDADVELIPGGRGIFDVKHDGVVIFSKHREDAFPTDGEIPARLRARA